MKRLFNVPLWGLLFLLVNCKEYRYISWAAYILLWVLWLVNTIYINLKIMPDLYYCGIFIIIYGTFAILTVAKLTNRW